MTRPLKYPGPKVCENCDTTFTPRSKSHHQRFCSPNCRSKNWANGHRYSRQRTRMLARYGINQQIFDEMFTRQGGACALCLVPFSRTPHIDHDHITGRVRGLLCPHCNVGVAAYDVKSFRDRVEAYVAIA